MATDDATADPSTPVISTRADLGEVIADMTVEELRDLADTHGDAARQAKQDGRLTKSPLPRTWQ